MLPRLLALLWAAICIIVATTTLLGMYITFAPSQGRTGELARAELAGIERVRNIWWDSICLSSTMLILSAVIIAITFWKRR